MGFFDNCKRTLAVGKDVLETGAYEAYIQRLIETKYDSSVEGPMWRENSEWVKVCNDGSCYDKNSVTVINEDDLKYVTVTIGTQMREGMYMLQTTRFFFVVPEQYLCLNLEFVGYSSAANQYFNRVLPKRELTSCKNDDGSTCKKLFEIFMPLFCA